ncbi:unnamed protein product [Clonostachys rhizophaga]|uniref:Siroheme synthase n=1 Tax=Clonostachys rhizophaga TaxID=160324 RepID=A0A9N9VKX0_9HYPO|nr:unnamed protein product [Clonostachys rhizophaga]
MSRRSARISSVSQASSAFQSSNAADTDADAAPPFFNTTFSTHSVSPLYVGPGGLTPVRLELLSRRLRDVLVGDVVRGIQIGLESSQTPGGQVGPLRSVKLQWFDAKAVLGSATDFQGEGSAWEELSDEEKRGLWIQIRHENAAYVAILMPGSAGQGELGKSSWEMYPGQEQTGKKLDNGNFLRLPLLLLRMPAALKNVIGEWLATTFDCRVSRLALGTRTITAVWEDWIQTVGLSPRGPDFVITLGFNAPLPDPDPSDEEDEEKKTSTQSGLRTMDIMIQPKDLQRLVRVGKTLEKKKTDAAWEKDPRERRRLAGPNNDNGWAWRFEEGAQSQPFLEALATYIDHHLALNMFHPSVRVEQISCGGFVLGQSRLKVVQQGELTEKLSQAAWLFVTRLGDRVRGDQAPMLFG